MKAPATAHNPWITAKARKLIQRLTADRTELQHDAYTEDWRIKGAPVSPKPARELLALCLLTTTLRSAPVTWYKITNEARQLLLNPSQRPVILTTRCRVEKSRK